MVWAPNSYPKYFRGSENNEEKNPFKQTDKWGLLRGKKIGNVHVGGRSSDLAISVMLATTVLMPFPDPSTYEELKRKTNEKSVKRIMRCHLEGGPTSGTNWSVVRAEKSTKRITFQPINQPIAISQPNRSINQSIKQSLGQNNPSHSTKENQSINQLTERTHQ